MISSASLPLAKRIPPRPLPKPQTELQRQGLRYERRVVRALRQRGCDLEHNPWFAAASGEVFVPDILIYELPFQRVIVIEVKLSYTPGALEKLNSLYCPIVGLCTGLRPVPLVITKTLVGDGDFAVMGFYQTLDSPLPVYQWLGHGPIT